MHAAGINLDLSNIMFQGSGEITGELLILNALMLVCTYVLKWYFSVSYPCTVRIHLHTYMPNSCTSLSTPYNYYSLQ